MEIIIKNISKNPELESEDFIKSRKINDRFICSIVSDGNGSCGLMSAICNFPFDGYNKQATFISFSTYQYSIIILNKICEYLLTLSIDDSISFKILKKIYGIVNDILLRDVRAKICFCSLLTIIDKHLNRLYYYSIGDCSFSIINLKSNKIKDKCQQKVTKIYYNNNTLYRIPESLSNSPEDTTIDMGSITLPKSYIFLLYSDGIDYDYNFPVSLSSGQYNIITNTYLNTKLDKLIKENNSKYYTIAIRKDEILRICLDKDNTIQMIMNKILHIVNDNIDNNRCKKDDIFLIDL